MAWTPISGTVTQYSTDTNELASGYYIKLYNSGTTTPYSMATDSTGGTLLAKCKLSAEGYPLTNPLDDSTVFIPHINQDYRIVLYRNEADADANTTANAAWNVDGVAQDVAQLADVSDISTKGTTLQVQDDYDRSPLFVDGTDFTAGAGPHLITVPSDWNPTDTSSRFYKISDSGIVTPLGTPITSATYFITTTTLLSTDTVFIGDDVFRNQMDGDPEDIRTRLSLSDADIAAKTNVTEQVFTSSGTWTRPTGCLTIEVQCIGGGGGGGGCIDLNYASAGGGGGGAYCKSIIDVSSIASGTVTVGLAGSAGAGADTGLVTVTDGGNGGDSSFIATAINVTSGGGVGGNKSVSITGQTGGGDGGAAISGDFKFKGGAGGFGYDSTTKAESLGGAGGSSIYGIAPQTVQLYYGVSPDIYGAGGAGGAGWSAFGYDGGVGGAGVCIVKEYY